MSFRVHCEVVCETCYTFLAGRWTTNTVPRKELKAEAKAKNAIFYDNRVFCSKICYTKYRDGEPQPCLK